MTAVATQDAPNAIEIVKRPKGFDNLVTLARDFAEDAIIHALNATERAYELGRVLVEFSEKSEVAKEVDAINKANKDAKRGGRPLAGHCYVAGMLAEDAKLSKAWLEKCARAFLKDRESGFTIGKALAVAKSQGKKALDGKTISPELVLPNPERLLPGGESEEEEEKLPPEKLAEKVVRPIQKLLFDENGKARLRSKAEVRAIANTLNETLRPFGFAVAPIGR